MKHLLLMALAGAVSLMPLAVISAPLPLPVIDLRKWNIELVASIAHDPTHKKVYAGTRSRDPQRHSLLVFDTDDAGSVVARPRRYSDHPAALPAGQWSVINCLVLDARHHKLFMGVGSTEKELTTTVVMYELDEQGEPVGAPQAFDNGNLHHATNALVLHPKLNRLYAVGQGGGGFGVLDLDATGKPTPPAVWQPTGTGGKHSIAIRADGTKLYLGGYPCQVEVADLDAAGNLAGKVRTYSAGEAKQYLIVAAGGHALYFKGPAQAKAAATAPLSAPGSLCYYTLDAAGEPTGAMQSVSALPVESVAAVPGADRLLVAGSEGFKDALSGKWVNSATQVKEFGLTANGAPGAVLRQSAVYNRRTAAALGADPGPALAITAPVRGFLGNRFAGLNVRVTLVSVQAEAPLPPATQTVDLSPQAKYLHFAYSATRSMVYATGENSLLAYSLPSEGGKVVSVPCLDVADAVAVDAAAGTLYAARKDGSVAVRKLDANGLPAATGADVATGIKPIGSLCLNPLTHQLYVLGGGKGAAVPGNPKIIALPAAPRMTDAVVDPEQRRLYACSSHEGTHNVWVWKLAPDGTPADPQPRRYNDGLPAGDGSRRGILTALRVDAARHKLYLGGYPETPTAGEGGVIVYDLNAQGDPTGAPRLYPTPHKKGSIGALEVAADGKWLYESGPGDANIFVHRLDDRGEPAKDAVAWPVGHNGNVQISVVAKDSNPLLLTGTHPSRLEIVRLERNGQPVGGLPATLIVTRPERHSDKTTFNPGVLTPGVASEWFNLDEALRDGVGTVVARLNLKGVPVTKATVKFEVGLADNGHLKPLKTITSELAGNVAALLLPLYGVDDAGKLPELVQSSEQRYTQYLEWAKKYALKPEERPQQFIVANGLIGLDSSPQALEAGLQTVELLGHNTMQIWNWPGLAPADIRAAAARHNFHQFRYAVYNPPSYFDFKADQVTAEFLDKWAADFKDKIARQGARPRELALFHLADEPGWYYPAILNQVKEKPERLAVFRNYLKSKGTTPEFLGKTAWDQIEPLPLSAARTLPDKHLLFWTARFFAESLSKAFAAATAALQRQLNPKILTTTNLNNWPGRHFVPSPGVKIGNNRDLSADAAEGMPDWFDLGRKKAVSCLWTEDWFSDGEAQRWSLYGDLLRCAAREGGVEFGGYPVGASTGAMPEGGTYKIMALTGHGAKAIDPYIFGPNPAFADGWSEREATYQSLADGIRILGKSERLLYPGRPRHGTVAILFPQASQVWDPDPKVRYYMQELYGLHAALLHENYPLDFVDDTDVEAGDLNKYGYAVLYVTAPNLSLKAQRAILEWTQAGGTLVLLPGAAAADEYNEPTDMLWKVAGANRETVARDGVPRPDQAANVTPASFTISDARLGDATSDTVYQSAPLTPTSGKALANFAGGKAALVAATTGKGRILSFGYWPGVTYWNSPDRSDRARLPQSWATAQRHIITAPARFADAQKHVDISEPLVEGAILESDKGVAVTLLNWSGNPLPGLTVTIAGAGKVTRVESVQQGALRFQITPHRLQVKLPLKAVDVLLLSR